MSDLMHNGSRDNRVRDHVTAWLGAYHDGEVNAALRARIEAHLLACPDCQRELDELRALSSMLQASPAPLSPVSDEDYARAVVGRVTRPVPPLWQRWLKTTWRYAPLFMFAAWAFFQALQWVSGAVLLGLRLVPGAQALLPSRSAPQDGFLLDLLRMGLPGSLTGLDFAQLPWLSALDSLVLLNLLVAAVLAVLFLSWLASWWAYHRLRAASQPLD